MASRIGPRIVGMFIVFAAALPVIYYGRQYVAEAKVYPGDVVEERDCRDCVGGKAEWQREEMPQFGDRCVMCGGDGKIDVILPGPERPTRVHGSVVNPEAFRAPIYDSAIPQNGQLLMPLPGGIPGVTVRFVRSDGGENIELETNSHGRFLAFLPPGDYEVRIDVPGFESYAEDLEIPVLTEPIWLEESTVLYEPESEAHAQSLYGISYRVYLERP